MEDRWTRGGYPEGRQLQSFVTGRQRTGQLWKTFFLAATVAGIIALLPGDYIDVRFSGNQNKDLRLETVSLVIRQIN